jgi:thiol-disulfide isomerase/thioredoxin
MTDTPPSSSRRLLTAGVALAAVAGGAWFASSRRSTAPAADPGAEALWSQGFDTPDGGRLAMSALRGKPLLINFWATWCAPCVREMPEIDRFYRDFSPKGWQVLGLAIDGPTPVREFLGRIKVGFAIGLAGLEGTELARQLGNERGGLPFTVAFDAAGRLVQRKLGETSYDELAGWAQALA